MDQDVAIIALTGAGVKPNSFIGHFAQAAYKASYRMLVEKVVYGKTDQKGIALNALSSAVGAAISTKIGAGHYNGEIQGLAHKALHGISGGIQGWIIRGKEGMAPGALGAVVAETVAETMTPTGGAWKSPCIRQAILHNRTDSAYSECGKVNSRCCSLTSWHG